MRFRISQGLTKREIVDDFWLWGTKKDFRCLVKQIVEAIDYQERITAKDDYEFWVNIESHGISRVPHAGPPKPWEREG